MVLPAADSFWDCVTFGILGKYINSRTLKMGSVVFKEETKEIRFRDFFLSVLPLPLLSHPSILLSFLSGVIE